MYLLKKNVILKGDREATMGWGHSRRCYSRVFEIRWHRSHLRGSDFARGQYLHKMSNHSHSHGGYARSKWTIFCWQANHSELYSNRHLSSTFSRLHQLHSSAQIYSFYNCCRIVFFCCVCSIKNKKMFFFQNF